MLPYGIMICALMKVNIKNASFFLLNILGILPLMILATIWGFIYRINVEFLIVITIISSIIYIRNKDIVIIKFRELRAWWYNLKPIWKISALAFIFITALQSSMPTNIPDDGFYYLQTIKWANEVGIPKGVARFGIQYGQFSTWHIIQAIFNLSNFFGNRFNILNGWILSVFILLAIYNLNYTKRSEQIFHLFVVFSAVFLQYFTTAPSPDLPVILLSLIIFKIFLFDEDLSTNLKIIVLLSLIAISIKISSFYLIFFVLAFGYKKILKDKRLIILTFIIGILLISKDLTTTGTLIYPFDFYTPDWIKWKIDAKILDEGKAIIKNSPIIGYSSDLLNDFNLSQKIKLWFNYKGYRGVANILWLLGIVILGTISFINKSKKYILVFVISVIHFLILWSVAPNYRFALAIIILDYFLIIYYFLGDFIAHYSKILIHIGLFFSIIWLTPLISPILKLSSNPVISISYPLKPEYFIIPVRPFISDSYEKRDFNGEEVFIPPKYHYALDGPLPCVMRNHFEKYRNKN